MVQNIDCCLPLAGIPNKSFVKQTSKHVIPIWGFTVIQHRHFQLFQWLRIATKTGSWLMAATSRPRPGPDGMTPIHCVGYIPRESGTQ